MTDYLLLASRFDYAAERDEKGFPTRIEKLHSGAIITDLDDAEAERLLSCGAVAVAEVQSTPPRKTRRTRKTAAKDATKAADGDTSSDSGAGSGDGGDDLDGLGDDDNDNDNDDADGDAGADTDGDTPVKGSMPKPANTADLAAWVTYAVDQGLDEAEANTMDRAALIKALA